MFQPLKKINVPDDEINITVYTLEINLLIFKSFFQFKVQICHAFIALIIEEQAERNAVRFPMFYHTSTAFFVIGASRFRASAFRHIRAIHFDISFL
jgi:hypothetical protein